MQDVSEHDGRTILFVSHQMESVQKLCNKGMLLQNGNLLSVGDINDVVQKYLQNNNTQDSIFKIEIPINAEKLNGYAYQLTVEDEFNKPINEIPMGKNWQVRIHFIINKPTNDFVIACGITSMLGLSIQTSWTLPENLDTGKYEVVFKNTEVIYSENQYKLVIGLSTEKKVIQYNDQAGIITISDVSNLNYDKRIINTKSGLLLNQMYANINKID
jgi:energy-coupling factor transporter ATP-binding protein EcfA2